MPVGHVDDAASLDAVCAVLRDLHGAGYTFAVRRWEGETRLATPDGRIAHRFLVRAEDARVHVPAGALVRGPSSSNAYEAAGDDLAITRAPLIEALWPGDVLSTGAGTKDMGMPDALVVDGHGVCFEVVTEASGYPAPALALLRHLPDHPKGCAAHPDAFRREVLPPNRFSVDVRAGDARGANRVNEHTLDMRHDRVPGPTTHFHGPVPVGPGQTVSHSETAIVLPRSAYGLPKVSGSDGGRAVIYLDPAGNPAEQVTVPVRPGSIVVTPGASGWTMGHRFENAFAMLVAIPGFVAPATYLERGG